MNNLRLALNNLRLALISLVLSALFVWALLPFAPPAAPAHAAGAVKSGRPAAAEQTIQIKLRDLLEMMPRKSSPEYQDIIARLTRIEQKLDVIAPLPPPVPEPAK